MKTNIHVQRRAARAMKRAVHEGGNPRNMVPKLAKVYKRLWRDDVRRRPWTASDGFNIWDIEGEGE